MNWHLLNNKLGHGCNRKLRKLKKKINTYLSKESNFYDTKCSFYRGG